MFKHKLSLIIYRHSTRFFQTSSLNDLPTNEKLVTQLLPAKIHKKRQKTPETLYLANEKGADIIASALKPLIPPGQTLLEFNPGIGLMTNKFSSWKTFRNIILIEPTKLNSKKLQEICLRHKQNYSIRRGDFINLWKIVYQDKLDGGVRVETLLENVPKKSFSDEPNLFVFGAVGSYTFFKHLINSVVFQNSLFSYGRNELYLVMPPAIFVHLTCSSDVGYMIYRSSSFLFQIFFEYRLIAKLPRTYFLPQQTEYKMKKGSKMGKVNSINSDELYLVKIVPRRNLFDFCPQEDIQALWYFVKQNCVSRRNRIIPNLEKYVPGCGARLIIQQSSRQPEIEEIYPDDDPTLLPKYSKKCVNLNNQSYCMNMNIHTEFGDLSPNEMLTLFCQFRSWPEYKECSFLASLENSLVKMEASVNESADVLDVPEEDDVNIAK